MNRDALSERGRGVGMLALLAFVCLLAGAIGAIATASSVESWYPGLAKPAWTPPDSVFGPVWTFLYVLMAVAAWLVWRRRAQCRIRLPMALFAGQLLLNTAWSLIFFGLRQPGLAAIEIGLLWLAILATQMAFARVSRAAAWLLLPYVAWVSFAALLNVAIWGLNAGAT